MSSKSTSQRVELDALESSSDEEWGFVNDRSDIEEIDFHYARTITGHQLIFTVTEEIQMTVHFSGYTASIPVSVKY